MNFGGLGKINLSLEKNPGNLFLKKGMGYEPCLEKIYLRMLGGLQGDF